MNLIYFFRGFHVLSYFDDTEYRNHLKVAVAVAVISFVLDLFLRESLHLIIIWKKIIYLI